MIICVAANPSVDKLYEIERLVPGSIHRPVGFVQTAGGKGLNVARAAHMLGADVTAAGILMGHAGKWLQETLQSEGIGGTFVWTDGESRSSVSVASRETGGLTEFYENGAVTSTTAWGEFTEAVRSLFAAGRWLTISGSLPRGVPEDAYHDLVVGAHAAQMQVALDTGGERLRATLPAGPDIVKVNAAEVSEMLGGPVEHRVGVLEAAERVRELAGGVGHAGVVTRGVEGLVVAAPDGNLYEGVLYEQGRYPVGSGDAFLAGLVVALERGRGWPSALGLALGTATANAEIPGAGKLDPARAKELADRAEIRRL